MRIEKRRLFLEDLGDDIVLNKKEQQTLRRAGEILDEMDRIATERFGLDWEDGSDIRHDLVIAADECSSLAKYPRLEIS